jgi:ATP-dependent phosphofructokinase / diphosphate-dependent phosphofructokinase
MKTIGICTGGGDCPGLNAVIRAAVKSAILQHGWRVIGIEDSFDGLIWPDKTRELTFDDVSGILLRGGTILGTTNHSNPLAYKVTEDGKQKVRDFSDVVFENVHKLGLDSLIVAGGDGTMAIALELFRKGLKLVGVPKTIDNDLSATEISAGFDTALHTATEAIDKIHTSAESHHRVMLVEVMGRNAGWIALESGIASGADVILIPEIPFSIQSICECVRRREATGRKFTIVVVAEGVILPKELKANAHIEKRSYMASTGIANHIADAITRCSTQDVRVTILGHIQRGGTPSPFDRLLCTRFGVAATELLAQEQFGRMVCLQGGRVASVTIEEALRAPKRVDPDGEMVRAARATGTCFGDE